MKTSFLCLVFLFIALGSTNAQTMKHSEKEVKQEQLQTKPKSNQHVQISMKTKKSPSLEEQINAIESKLQFLKDKPRADKKAIKGLQADLKSKKQALARQAAKQ